MADYLIDMFHCRPDILLHPIASGRLPVGRREEDLIWSRHTLQKEEEEEVMV